MTVECVCRAGIVLSVDSYLTCKAFLEEIRAEFASLPNVLKAEIEVVPASVRIRAYVETLSFENTRPIYHKEMEIFDRTPELRFGVDVEVARLCSDCGCSLPCRNVEHREGCSFIEGPLDSIEDFIELKELQHWIDNGTFRGYQEP